MEIVIKDVKINYISYGSGKDVLLLHGWGQNIEMMKKVGDGLKDNYRVTIMDLPGFGKSEATTFVPEGENSMYPPFSSIDGLGDTVAKNIVVEREKKPFLSIEDLQKRAKISSTLIDKMRLMGILKDLPESSQLTLF